MLSRARNIILGILTEVIFALAVIVAGFGLSVVIFFIFK